MRRVKIESIAQKVQSKMLLPFMLFMTAIVCFLMGSMFLQVFSLF